MRCFLSRAGYHVVELIIWVYFQTYFSGGHVLVLIPRTALVNQGGVLYRGTAEICIGEAFSLPGSEHGGVSLLGMDLQKTTV